MSMFVKTTLATWNFMAFLSLCITGSFIFVTVHENFSFKKQRIEEPLWNALKHKLRKNLFNSDLWVDPSFPEDGVLCWNGFMLFMVGSVIQMGDWGDCCSICTELQSNFYSMQLSSGFRDFKDEICAVTLVAIFSGPIFTEASWAYRCIT